MSMRRQAVLRGALLALVAALAPLAGAAAPSEYDVKAALVFKIAKFVAWPDATLSAGTVNVCHMVSRDAARSFNALAGQTIGGRAVAIKPIVSEDDPTACHVLYVGAAQELDATAMLRRIAGEPVLTIGETDSFALRAGGVIALKTDTRRVRFAVNLGASRRAGLQINSQLLKLATVIDERVLPSATAAKAAP
jgi:YfiR/HmsC-like